MEATVRIEGVDYAPCEIAQSGTYCGIKTPKKTFWVFPVCDDEGHEVKSFPPFLPREIRAVTIKPPDLTQRFPETVKELFDTRRSYFSTATLQKYQNQYPDGFLLTEEQFQKERNRILSEPLVNFVLDPRARQMVWDRHGTRELANQVGYLGNVFETETLENGRKRRFSTMGSVAESLVHKLIAARKVGEDAARAIVNTLKYVMIYEDVPEQQFIYLEGMKMAAYPPAEVSSAAGVANDQQAQIKKAAAPALHWPGFERAEKLIRRQEKLTAEEAKNITERKKLVGQERKLEELKEQNRKETARLARERSRQRVNRQQICEAFKVKTDRGALKICKRHQVDWPQTQGQLDRLVQKHERRKKSLAEALVKRNIARAQKRRSNPEERDREDF